MEDMCPSDLAEPLAREGMQLSNSSRVCRNTWGIFLETTPPPPPRPQTNPRSSDMLQRPQNAARDPKSEIQNRLRQLSAPGHRNRKEPRTLLESTVQGSEVGS